VAKKREHCKSTKNRQVELSPISGIASSKSRFLLAKQHVPIFTHHVPPHPGAKPTQHNGPEWEGKKNACYFLLMYQPKPLRSNSMKLDYTWDAFQK